MKTEDAAALLAAAREEGRTLTPFTDDHPDLDEAWGYAVQHLDRAARQAAGERVVGAKLGLTSAAKQERMQVHRPIVGFLTDAHLLDADAVGARLAAWSQPRIEPEIAFVIAADLDREIPRAEAPGLVSEVLVAAEILDSRFTDYRFRLPDVLADATSAAAVVRGPGRPPGDLDLRALTCRVQVDDEVVETATGAAILGDPWRALIALAAHLADCGETLPAGSLVLAGALTDAVPLATGRCYHLAIEALGEVVVDLSGGRSESPVHR